MSSMKLLSFALLVATAGICHAADAPEFDPRVTDITVFKDGHALVMARGQARFADGACRTREVPVPVLGAFWAFSPDQAVRIEAVTSHLVTAESRRPCLSFDEMIQANAGKRATIVEQFKDAAPASHEGVILGILQDDTPREADTTRMQPAEPVRYGYWHGYQPPQEVRETREVRDRQLAGFVMLQTNAGVRLIARDSIRGITLADAEPATTFTDSKQVREITVRASRDGKPLDQAEIGFVYVQKGIRWIPDYRIELLEGGKARIRLQATVINELADFDDADLRLVVGVPSILMQGDRSPMALRDAAVRLSAYFSPPNARGGGNRYGSFDNALMSQSARPYEPDVGGSPDGPNVPSEGQREDLFVFHQPRVSLKKGECTILQLFETVVSCEDLYTWEIGPVPPRELLDRIGHDEQARLLASLTGARAMHTIRLANTSNQPWTTGPASIFKDGTFLAQQLMTYTSAGGTVDVPITVATDLATSKQEVEVGRENDVGGTNNHRPFMTSRITLKGKLVVRSFKHQPVRLIVTRKAFGTATEAGQEGTIHVNNSIEDTSIAAEGYGESWRSPVWPTWWTYLNPVTRITWDKTIAPGESITLDYTWYYDFRN